MILSIDIGGTNTHGVLMEKRKVISACTIEGKDPGHVRECFGFLSKRAGNGKFGLVLTGGGARKKKPADLPVPFSAIDEISAIGAGG
jgi:activator of 2-hydroxyglutaryl-CoA dehydratase